MYRIICVTVSILLILSGIAVCQEEPKADIFGGYQFLRGSTGVSGVDNFNLNGWNASATGYFHKYLGVAADFSGAYGSPFGVSGKIHTFMFGPVVRVPNSSKITPFVHALFGGAHVSASAGGFSAGETDFAWAAGGGLDAKLNNRFGVRIVQADFLQTRFGGIDQNNFRFSTGVLIHF